MTMAITIQPVEIEGEHFVTVNMDGSELSPHGPYSTAGEAEATAVQFAGICQCLLHQPVTVQQRATRRRAEKV